MKNFEEFEKKIKIDFEDKNLLKKAFTHRSYINEVKDKTLGHNERLEFLGDAVLELIVTDHLFLKYIEKTEGELTSVRAALVNTITLSEAASELEMGDFILLSKGETKDTGKARQYILADAFEALLGAIYLDRGYDIAKEFVAGVLFEKVDEIVEKSLWQDSKSLFQEKAQEAVGVTPAYKVIKESGPDHDKTFNIGVMLNKEVVAEGKGRSKQEAEQEAARSALVKKGWE